MNTVTLRQDAYAMAQRYAQKQKITVDEVMNNLVLAYFVNSHPKKEISSAEDNMYSWDELMGMFQPTGKTDRELIDEYLDEKYGL